MPEKEKKKALVIGVSDYRHFRTLNFCEKDGNEMVNILGAPPLGYQVTTFIGQVNYDTIRDTIRDFFLDPSIKSKDTLLFYFSGHGIQDRYGDHYFAAFETDPEDPGKRGVSFDELERVINNSLSTRIVTILDCCYGGAARLPSRRINKGTEDNAAKIGRQIIEKKIRPGKGKCILAACLGTQEAQSTLRQDYSIYTYYVLEGLKGQAADPRGNITPDSLAQYTYDMITSLPVAEKPNQIPIKKIEAAGDIVLAHYPDKVKKEKEVLDKNKALLKLLRQGKIKEFYKKQGEDPYRSLDLHGVDLARIDLEEVKLWAANLSKSNLAGANLREADLRLADLREANLSGANFEKANLARTHLWRANLNKANLNEAYLVDADIRDADLRDADLSKAMLIRTDFGSACLTKAKLVGADMEESNLMETDLNGANLRRTKNLPISKEKARKRGAII